MFMWMGFIYVVTGGGECEDVVILVAIAANTDEHRAVLGVAEDMKEDKTS